jgi:hypothetical protein
MVGALFDHPLEPDYHGIKDVARIAGEFLALSFEENSEKYFNLDVVGRS